MYTDGMKLLHTADWHLGKLFYEHSLEEDQEYFLSQILGELKRASDAGGPYDALIVSGDIYDRAVPPASASVMLDSFLTKACAQSPGMHIFITAGNHDSAERLSFGKALFERHNLHICTDVTERQEPVLVNGVAVYQLPFLTPSRVGTAGQDESGTPPRTQAELLDAALDRIARTRKEGIPAVLSAHLFAAGTMHGESERAHVGTAEQVDAAAFSDFAYVALGHIHTAQKAGKNAWYAGSPLSYSFGEKSYAKEMLSVTIRGTAPEETEIAHIPFVPLRPVTTITASYDDALHSPAFSFAENHFVQIECTDRGGIANPMASLSRRFPHILSFVYKAALPDGQVSSLTERRELLGAKTESPESVFNAFLEDIYGTETLNGDPLADKEAAAFLRILHQTEDDE